MHVSDSVFITSISRSYARLRPPTSALRVVPTKSYEDVPQYMEKSMEDNGFYVYLS